MITLITSHDGKAYKRCAECNDGFMTVYVTLHGYAVMLQCVSKVCQTVCSNQPINPSPSLAELQLYSQPASPA